MAGLDHLKLSLSQSSRDTDTERDERMGLYSSLSLKGQERDTSRRGSDDGYDHLRTVFKTVSLATRKRMEMGLESLIHYLENSKSQDLLRYNIVAIFSISLEDKDIALKAGIVYGAIYTLAIGKDTVQSILVQEIHKELKEHGFGKGNRERFLNAVFLLSEIYFHIGPRPEDEPISILGKELLNCFRQLLSGQEEELEILATCLIINGICLKKQNTTIYESLLLDIRRTLLARNISVIGKCLILLIIDIDNINFTSLPEDVMLFYMMHLGVEGFKRLERMRWSPTSSSARMSGSVEVSTVEASTVEASTVEASTVEVFTIEASTVEASTVEASTVEASTVEASTVEASTVEVFTIEASTVEASTVDAFTVEASTVEVSTVEASAVEASVIEQLPPRTQHTEHSQSGNRKKPSMPLYTPPPMRQHYPQTQPHPSRLREITELQVIDMSTSMRQNPEHKSDNLKVCSYNIPCQSLNKNDSQDYDDSEKESNDLDEEFAKVGLSPILEEDEAERGEDGKESWFSENDK